MTRYQSQKYIEQQLVNLNRIIDQKIIRGESYRREAARHKLLTKRLRSLRNESGFTSLLLRLIKN